MRRPSTCKVNTIGVDLAKLRMARHLVLACEGGNDAWRFPCPNPRSYSIVGLLDPKGRHVFGSSRCHGGCGATNAPVGGGQRQRLGGGQTACGFCFPLWPQGSNWHTDAKEPCWDVGFTPALMHARKCCSAGWRPGASLTHGNAHGRCQTHLAQRGHSWFALTESKHARARVETRGPLFLLPQFTERGVAQPVVWAAWG